jgi:hypothetical protein
MNIQHTSRTGKIYYLHVMAGKDGKAKYHFSTRRKGTPAESFPDGFEIYENVRGQVFLQRKRPQLITDEELALVKEALRRHAEEWRYKIEVKENTVTIFEAEDCIAALQSIALPWISKDSIKQHAIQTAHYMAVMRFMLADKERRLFRAERFCFRGSIDDWIDIGGAPQPLQAILSKFIRRLGKESLYEM